MNIKSFLLKSRSNNNYYRSSKTPQLLLIHPILKHLIELEEKGVRLSEWLDEISVNKINIDGEIIATKSELLYYIQYYDFLKKNMYAGVGRQVPEIQKNYTADIVKNNVAGCENILFEVTDACQLRCNYCGYGDLYGWYDKRTSKNLSVKSAQRLIDYCHELRDSTLNGSTSRELNFGFFGGEPLLNFRFITEIVDYIKSKHWSNTSVKFGITTNGILLDKHMDFLVKNEFHLVISLDGNESNNAFRVFKNGKPSFQTVYENTLKVRDKYPKYFEKKVGFIAVSHKKNSLRDVETFFDKNFGKTPVFDDLSMVGIKPDKIDDFHRIYKQKYSDLKAGEISLDMTQPQKMRRSPYRLIIKRLIDLHTNNRISRYSQLFNSEDRTIVSGTCGPFGIRIFLTVNGKLLPCERIPQNYSLGEVDDNEVKLNFQEIADKYNSWHDKVNKHCNVCHTNHFCSQCIFHLNLEKPSCTCDSFKNFNTYKEDLENDVSTLEVFPELYTYVINESKLTNRWYNKRKRNEQSKNQE